MNKKQKNILTIMIILLILSTGSFLTGVYFRYFEGNEEVKPNKPIPISNTTYSKNLKFKYFLEDEEQTDMPTNSKKIDENNNTVTSDDYMFARYVCTNNIKGEFNAVTWEFIPNSDEEGECELYFVKSKYEVTVTSPNGTVDNNVQMVTRQEDAAFVIEPNKGYSFKKAECSNGKEAKWDASTKTLKIEAIMSDVTCNVSFEKNKLSVNLKLEDAKTATLTDGELLQANYGDPVKAIVKVNSDYVLAENGVTCTNDQVGKWEANMFTIEQLTSDTECVLKFKEKEKVYYTFKINNPDNSGVALVGETTREIEEGKTFTLEYKHLGSNNITLNCDVKPTKGPITVDDKTTYVWDNVSSNINCSYQN